jgi:hypothetical protein
VLDHFDLSAGLTARNGLAPDDARAMLAVLGLPAALGEEFPCVLPGYEGTLSSVVDPESLRYQTLYEGSWRTWWSLAEVYACRIGGRLVTLPRGASHHRFWLRLRYHAGLIDLDVPALDLPPHLSIAATRLAHGFALAAALSEARHPGEPISYARRFASVWCGLPERAAGEGLRELRAAGVLLQSGALDTPGRKPTPLYHLAPAVTSDEPSTSTTCTEAIAA